MLAFPSNHYINFYGQVKSTLLLSAYGQKMDTAVQELGSGAQPDDRPLWGQAYPVFIKRKNRDTTS